MSRPVDENQPSAERLQVPPARLSAEALIGLVDEFITAEGTDYGHVEHSLQSKRDQVLGQIEQGEAAIFFDPSTGGCTLEKV